jgi:predicted RND superfamily exporter protein
METNKNVPTWLKKGAFEVYENKSTFSIHLLIVMFLVFIITIISLVYFNLEKIKSFNILSILGIYVIIVCMTIFIYTLIYLRKKIKVSESKKWQQLYLQSKIDEAKSYELRVPDLIKNIQERYKKEIEVIRNNEIAMNDKKLEAELLLT